MDSIFVKPKKLWPSSLVFLLMHLYLNLTKPPLPGPIELLTLVPIVNYFQHS
jgi:hypothetical protein